MLEHMIDGYLAPHSPCKPRKSVSLSSLPSLSLLTSPLALSLSSLSPLTLSPHNLASASLFSSLSLSPLFSALPLTSSETSGKLNEDGEAPECHSVMRSSSRASIS